MQVLPQRILFHVDAAPTDNAMCTVAFRFSVTSVRLRAHECYDTQSCLLAENQSSSNYVQVRVAYRSLHRSWVVITPTYKLAVATVNEHCLIM